MSRDVAMFGRYFSYVTSAVLTPRADHARE
jgi:hypothetical protein